MLTLELCRYLLAESKDAVYVSFIGTKQRRDIMTNANIMQEPLWPEPRSTPLPLHDQVSSNLLACRT